MIDFDAIGFPADNPELRRRMYQCAALHDAAVVLDEVKPPTWDVVAEFLRQAGTQLMRELGMGEEFIEAALRARPRLGERL